MDKTHRYGVCVENRDYEAALEIRKIYRLIEDATAKERGMVRVVDESGEDYLYSQEYFVPNEVPRAAVDAFSKKIA